MPTSVTASFLSRSDACAVYNKGRLSKDDIRLITNKMICNTMIPAVYLREELLHNSPRQEKYKYTR